jgi:phytoene synthase
MPVRLFRDRRPRLLAPSRILRETPRQTGGWREREELVAEAGETITRSSPTFTLATRLLDRRARERIWLLYAWCRHCDDLADEKNDPADAVQWLEAIRVLTRRALEGEPTAVIGFDSFGQVAKEAGLTAEMAEDVIEGFALDVAGWRPRTEADLMRYCYHVAGAVGVMAARALGVPEDDHEALDRACDLGLSFELVNMARNMWKDDADERSYLPLEWLVEADIPPGETMKPVYREELVALVARLLDLAEEHAAAARYGAAQLPFRHRWAVLTAANIYGAVAREVRELGPTAWDHRVRKPAAARLRAVARAFRDALRKPQEPAQWPCWTRGELLIAVRMAGPIAPIPMTPLPDEEAT